MDTNSSSTRDPDSNPLESMADQQGFLVIPDPDIDQDDLQRRSYEIKIPGYTILEKIGRGGSSIVYRACIEDNPKQLVAIKIFMESVLNRESLVRFNRETQSLGKLQHPSIAKLINYGIGEDSYPYLVMELIEGKRIDHHCQESELSTIDRIELFLKVCRAVQYAHENGVLHRDLKPANILIDSAGNPHLTDFGLAKFLGSDTPTVDKTRTGAVLGTLNYLAPEQVFNLKSKANEATDVFGLGAVLHSLLTGNPPMKFHSFVEAAREYFNKLPVEIDQQYGVPTNLEAICIKCLAPGQSLRYQSVSALINELQSYLDGNSVSAKTQKYLRKFSLLRRQYPWLIRTTLVVFLITVAGALIFFSLWRSSVDSLQREEQTTKELKSLSLGLGDVANKIRFNDGSPEMLKEREGLLGSLAQLYEKLLQRFPDDPDLLFAAAENHYKLARMQHHLGNRKAQYQSYEKAKEIFEKLLKLKPRDETAREALFQVLMSLEDHHGALDLMESLYADYPDNVIYESCVCSVNLAIAQKNIGDEAYGKSIPYLEAGIRILDNADPSQKSETWYIDKSIQANLLLARKSLIDQRLEDAQMYCNRAVEYCQSRDPFESGVVSYSAWYLQSLDFAFSIAAYRNDHELANDIAKTANEFFPNAQQRYAQFIEIYEHRCNALANRAVYCLLNEDSESFELVESQWQQAIGLWDANAPEKNLDFHRARLAFATLPFRQKIDKKQAIDALDEFAKFMGDKPTYFGVRAEAYLRLGDLQTAKQLLQRQMQKGPTFRSSAYLKLIESIENNTDLDQVNPPAISEEMKLRLFAIHQSYNASQLDQQLKHDLRHYKQNRN